MTQMKKTLLHEVQDIEREAAALIQRAKEQAGENAAELKKRTQESRASVLQKATQTSEAIVRERKEKAQKEAQQIAAQNRSVASQVHASAEKNRARALEKAKQFFNTEYGTSL